MLPFTCFGRQSRWRPSEVKHSWQKTHAHRIILGGGIPAFSQQMKAPATHAPFGYRNPEPFGVGSQTGAPNSEASLVEHPHAHTQSTTSWVAFRIGGCPLPKLMFRICPTCRCNTEPRICSIDQAMLPWKWRMLALAERSGRPSGPEKKKNKKKRKTVISSDPLRRTPSLEECW